MVWILITNLFYFGMFEVHTQ